MKLYKEFFESELGTLTLLSDEKNLLGLWFNGQKYFGADYDLTAAKVFATRPIKQALKWLTNYFAGQTPDPFAVSIKPNVSTFSQKVLKELQKVPYGEVTTYKELSNRVQKGQNKINLARAVGNAVKHNPISLIIPCHRVIGSDGSLTGYAGGLERKRALLKMENPQIKFSSQLDLL
ncbi:MULTISPECIES: methylated-DNA--[protein]-cysteine S-methyltransferase [Lactobacillus]|uniref:methylated-DNA--[protein]-cysteine S-methyltransferase n=1 Tax=Lactobacillus TaxID=1578 RepID=UPI0018DD4A4C|nr:MULTISPECIES: methylated-DNA--[protein]-cysteine S-methyltransferase [Lactobacillus]MBI0033091.1 methylated-DNA--[protein]-cysteine S-methyltransferase [Lactobacillus sp. M0396]